MACIRVQLWRSRFAQPRLHGLNASKCPSQSQYYASAVSRLQLQHISALATDSERRWNGRIDFPPHTVAPQSHTQHRKYNVNTSYRQSQLASTNTALYTLEQVVCGKSFPLRLPSSSLHTSPHVRLPDKKLKNVLEAKPTIEKAVDTLKEKKKKVEAPKKEEGGGGGEVAAGAAPKPSLGRRLWEAVVHYYHGFRLLVLDTRVAVRLLWKTMRGNALTRREQKQFRRTVGDIFRVVPFSVFVVVPFMEFLLPVYIWLFPNALPSTFQSTSSKEARKKQQLKTKLQMAKFLQDTLEDMAVTSKSPNKHDSVQEFAQFFDKIRKSGAQASTEEILYFSKLFEDELTLDSLSRPFLVALCKLLVLQPIGSSNFLRFQLRMKLRQLRADDQLILKEGVESLTEAELQAASQARGMRALGMPAQRLKSQLSQWLDLHLNQAVPTSLLLLSRALYLPEDIPASNALQATLSTLPENIVEETEVRVADTVGESVDNKMRLELIRQQEQLIREEALEKEREKEELEAAAKAEAGRVASEEMKDPAPVITPSTAPEPVASSASVSTVPATAAAKQAAAASTAMAAEEVEKESISAEELRGLSQAVSALKGKQLEDEREALEELKEDREEYSKDVADLAVEGGAEELKESKGSARLGRRVEAMISKLDQTLQTMEEEFVGGEETSGSTALNRMQEEQPDTITTEQLEAALSVLKAVSGEAKVKSLIAVLDEDHDGNINLDEIAEVVEVLATEDTDIKPEHIDQIKELIKKELTLEGEEEKEAVTI